jgi:uncharacterized circularly permuted ATP-grasp superfamily protein
MTSMSTTGPESVHYATDGFFDEMFHEDAQPRAHAAPVHAALSRMAQSDLIRYQRTAEDMLRTLGATFLVYNHNEGTEKILPFDVVPRVISELEWLELEHGLRQRIRALNLFLSDIYGEQRIIEEGVIPFDVIKTAAHYRPACKDFKPPGDIWCHITGTDLIRHTDGRFYVLEDNLRCPSGVSYVLENRRVMKRTFPRLFQSLRVKSVEDYPDRLLEMLIGLAPAGVADPTVVVLTPGVMNSAYFEHSLLARSMGATLVEGRDLVIHDDRVFMRSTQGFQRVDVIYRRIDDDFLDPLTFRPDSLIGVPGLMNAYKKGHVAIANAPGTGVADDKVVYAFVPDMVRFYLGEEPLLPNVPTYLCWRPDDCAYVLEHLDSLVVKSANEAGGYGMLIGPQSSAEERESFRQKIIAAPRNFIAQPVMALSRVPIVAGDRLEGRHVDLRPYILYGRNGIYTLPGGLTRVALRKGSLVVNSSQGGGSKDTWVIAGNEGLSAC